MHTGTLKYCSGPFYSESEERPLEHFTALAALTALLGKRCLSLGAERTVTALFDALQVLAKNGADGIANLLVPDFVDLVLGLQPEDLSASIPVDKRHEALAKYKFDTLLQIRYFAWDQLWFAEMAVICGQLVALVEQNKNYAPADVALDLRREKILIELENGLCHVPKA